MALGAVTNANYRGYLKDYWTRDKLWDMTAVESPGLAILERNEDPEVEGFQFVQPILFGTGQGASYSFDRAQANVSSGLRDRFLIQPATDYAVATVSGLVMAASRGDVGAFAKAADATIEEHLATMRRRAARAIYGSGSGNFARIAAVQPAGMGVGTPTIRLATAEDIIHFQPDMRIRVADGALADGAAVGARAGSLVVSAIDEDNGDVTVVGNWNAGIAAVAVSDWIHQDGDYNLAPTGFEAWDPASNPGTGGIPSVLHGVPRAVAVNKLGGLRQAATVGATIKEKLTIAYARGHRGGAKFTHFLINPTDMSDLQMEMADKASYTTFEKGEIRFRMMQMNADVGNAVVVDDPYAPRGIIRGINSAAWNIPSLGPMLGFLDQDGQDFLRQGAADGIEIRLGGYWNTGCGAPGHTIRIAA